VPPPSCWCCQLPPLASGAGVSSVCASVAGRGGRAWSCGCCRRFNACYGARNVCRLAVGRGARMSSDASASCMMGTSCLARGNSVLQRTSQRSTQGIPRRESGWAAKRGAQARACQPITRRRREAPRPLPPIDLLLPPPARPARAQCAPPARRLARGRRHTAPAPSCRPPPALCHTHARGGQQMLS